MKDAVVVLVAKSCPTLCDLMDCSLPGSSVTGISQVRKSGLPFPSPGDLPNPGIQPMSPSLAGGFFTAEPSGRQIQDSSKTLVNLCQRGACFSWITCARH